MMEVKQLVPKLRFREFDGEWRKVTLFDLSDNVSYGMNASAIAFDGVHKYLRITDIDEETGTFKPKPLTSPDGEISDKFKLQKDDIVFTRTGASVGKPYLYNEKDGDLYYAGFLIKFSITKGDSYFIYNLTQKEAYNKWVHVYSMRSDQPGLNAEEYKALKLSIPSLPEQQKIASFLSAVDEKIQQLTKKKELLEHYKKGVMQQLFSGKLRFKDADGKDFPEWVDRILDDVIHFSNGKGHEQNIDPEGDFVVVNSKFVSTEGKIRKYCNTQISPLNKGDIVMVMSDVPNGKALAKCYLIEKDNMYTLNQRICGLKAKNNVNEFLIYLIHRNRYYLSFDSGVGQTNLKKDEVLNCPLFIPSSIEEQQKIATYLSNIDNKIESVNQQITQTQTFKKGLLQQMFV